MIYPMVLFPVTIFRGHGVTISLDSLDILSAQLKRDLFSIGKFLSLSARAGSLVLRDQISQAVHRGTPLARRKSFE